MLLGNDIEGCQLFYFLEGLSPEKKSLCSCGFFRDRKKKRGRPNEGALVAGRRGSPVFKKIRWCVSLAF
jgi:hypothetical protein